MRTDEHQSDHGFMSEQEERCCVEGAQTIILMSPGCPQYNNYCSGGSGVSACAQLSVQYAHVCA